MSVAYSGPQNVCSKFHNRNSTTLYSLYHALKQTKKSTQNLYNFYFLDFFLKLQRNSLQESKEEKKKNEKEISQQFCCL